MLDELNIEWTVTQFHCSVLDAQHKRKIGQNRSCVRLKWNHKLY
jgi:hypothetical protein